MKTKQILCAFVALLGLAAALREKYGLGNRTVRMFTPMMPGRRQNPPQQNRK